MTTEEHCQQVAQICDSLYGEFSIEWGIGLYHDYIEDGLCNIEDIRTRFELFDTGWVNGVIAGILDITRSKDESYFEYILRCKKNYEARRVKLVDLMLNLHLREEEPKESLKKRYSKALKMLME